VKDDRTASEVEPIEPMATDEFGSAEVTEPQREEAVSRQEKLDHLVEKTLTPMLLTDDDRCYVRANLPACEVLDLSEERILSMKVEDLTAPQYRDQVPAMFQAFVAAGSQSGPYMLLTPEGREIPCFYCATANVLPGLHLSALLPLDQVDPVLDQFRAAVRPEPGRLSARERQVMSLLALGENNMSIAAKLGRSPETVRKQTLSARNRLGARSRSHAIALAIQAGELDLYDPLADS
jgi:DNA-binding CsgD family transcriptional regulator